MPETIEIHTEFVRLDSFLKFAAAAGSGGEAKTMVQEGLVQVNGETCLQRTKKLRDGDTVLVGGETYLVRGGAT